MLGSEIRRTTLDLVKGLNTKVWDGVEGAEKVRKIVKTGIYGTNFVIGTNHALEDFGWNNYVCGSLDVLGSVSSAVGLILGIIPSTKSLTFITGSVTVGYRSVRYYCKR
jgi:hypothetical protein